jgi:hypothetical protein
MTWRLSSIKKVPQGGMGTVVLAERQLADDVRQNRPPGWFATVASSVSQSEGQP